VVAGTALPVNSGTFNGDLSKGTRKRCVSMGDRIRIGGVLRCCLEIERPSDAAPGTVVKCPHCRSGLVLASDGVWEGWHDPADPGDAEYRRLKTLAEVRAARGHMSEGEDR
jgi:hypothetical protein